MNRSLRNWFLIKYQKEKKVNLRILELYPAKINIITKTEILILRINYITQTG